VQKSGICSNAKDFSHVALINSAHTTKCSTFLKKHTLHYAFVFLTSGLKFADGIETPLVNSSLLG